MALAERAELVARLSLKDDFSGASKRVASNFSGSMAKMRSAAGRTGRAIGVGLGAGLAVGAAVTLRAVRSGIDSLTELEDATTSVDGAIAQMGLTGKVTSGQIATWANEIEAATQAAFDDKAITQAATTLLRYGKVAPKDLKTTLTVMTDLAAKTGSVDSAASKLAKSLADPTKATRVLREVGVTLTKAQQKQIKVWVENGELGKAQALILEEVGKQVEGAAAAMNGPMRDASNTLSDVMEDATRALAIGFLPVLMEVRDVLSQELAKKSTLDNIKKFGEGLAGGLKGLVSAVRGVDWDSVGTSLKIAGTGAKAVYDAFMGMPDWIKTAVLTGWGLNKVTGGAVGDLVGSGIEVGLKGVFGQFFARGASPANPMWVAGTGLGGGTPGGVVTGGKGGSLLGAVTKVFIAGMAAGLATELWGQREQQSAENKEEVRALGSQTGAFTNSASLDEMKASLAGIEAYEKQLAGSLTPEGLAYAMNIDGVADAINDTEAQLSAKIAKLEGAAYTVGHRADERADNTAAKVAAATTAINTAKVAQISAIDRDRSAIVTAIKNSKPVINLKVNVSNTSRVRVYQTGGTVNRSGAGSGPGGPMREEDLR